MQKTKYKKVRVLVVALTALASLNLQATDESSPDNRAYRNEKNTRPDSAYEQRIRNEWRAKKDSAHASHVQASKLIGKKVTNDQGERLGRVADLILADDFAVKYAVISVGGALGVGGNKVLVPITDLNCGSDSIRLSASKDDLKNAAKIPSGAWIAVSSEAWTRDINGYYGQPIVVRNNLSDRESGRYEREPLGKGLDGREPVRAEQGAQARNLVELTAEARAISEGDSKELNPTDITMRQSVNDTIRQGYAPEAVPTVNVTVENGVVTLHGNVESKAEKQRIETRVKAIEGVSRVNNQLTISN